MSGTGMYGRPLLRIGMRWRCKNCRGESQGLASSGRHEAIRFSAEPRHSSLSHPSHSLPLHPLRTQTAELEEEVRELESVFLLFDKDGSGQLSADEVSMGC